jgi:broad specificity phosphatase PhoE
LHKNCVVLAVTVFHLLRHGEHSLQGKLVAGRSPGISLSPRGQGEAERAAERLAGAGIAAVYASPLERTRETGEIVARRLDLPLIIREALVELDFGEWTGSTFEAVRRDPRWPHWATNRSLACIPGGESMREVQRRIVETLIEVQAEHPQGTVVLVSHGDVIRAGLVFVLGMPLDFSGRIEVATGSISTVRIDAAGIRVIALNERP